MSKLILYYQPDCHLCDDAEELLMAAGLLNDCERVDIESDLELLKQYGIHVPVLLRKKDQQELFWPFDLQELTGFVGKG